MLAFEVTIHQNRCYRHDSGQHVTAHQMDVIASCRAVQSREVRLSVRYAVGRLLDELEFAFDVQCPLPVVGPLLYHALVPKQTEYSENETVMLPLEVVFKKT